MIRASCGGAHLTVRGHAGYGEYGKDIVCAAASALVYALAGRLRETGRLERFQSAPGYAEIAGTGDCAREFALVRCGHLRLKLAGDGPCRVYSAAAVYEKGSDGP